ncbi:MAG: hypothetical protein QF441_11995 [Bacteriovoracaceae bacterium]|nr:hypothetical protein [Halobacteriovoraceae bacterium]MDP7321327.1 hypothetical protein [Bacteriovoracaceae bacterium]|tara:strand:+ start:362 stop:760 length:399 start_codon:yes stop_codon:yes gene_type:complete
MKFSCKIFIYCFLIVFSLKIEARDHLIFSVAEDLPMGYENEVIRRNYYINMGSNQGLSEGAVLDVYRTISKANPYDNQKRVNYRIPIGQLEVIHTEDESAVALVKKVNKNIKDPVFDINNFMIGDHVAVSVK